MIRKLNWFFCCLFLVAISSCGSDNNDTPNFPEPEPEVNTRFDWTVRFIESNWQNPKWVIRENNSKECLDWKEENKEQLTFHDSRDNNTVTWWLCSYKDYTEDEVMAIVNRFVSWTIDPDKTITQNQGSDIFYADVWKADYTYFSTHEYSTYYKDEFSDRNGWRISFMAEIYDDKTKPLSLPNRYYTWCSSNEKNLTKDNVVENNHSQEWIFEFDTYPEDIIDEQIEPFVLMTIEDTNNHKSYARFNVTVYEYRSNYKVTYSKGQL